MVGKFKKIVFIFQIIQIFFIFFEKGYGYTLGNINQGGGVVTIGKNNIEFYTYIPEGIYRKKNESLKNITIVTNKKLITLKYSKLEKINRQGKVRIIYELKDELGGEYSLTNVKISKENNSSRSSAKFISPNFILIEDFIPNNQEMDSIIEISGDIIYTSGEKSGKTVASLNYGVFDTQKNLRKTGCFTSLSEVTTILTVEVGSMFFPGVIIKSGIIYEAKSGITIQGDQNTNVFVSLDGTREQSVESTLSLPGKKAVESIPIKYTLEGTQITPIQNGWITLSDTGRGALVLKGEIDTNNLSNGQKEGTYTGTVVINASYN